MNYAGGRSGVWQIPFNPGKNTPNINADLSNEFQDD